MSLWCSSLHVSTYAQLLRSSTPCISSALDSLKKKFFSLFFLEGLLLRTTVSLWCSSLHVSTYAQLLRSSTPCISSALDSLKKKFFSLFFLEASCCELRCRCGARRFTYQHKEPIKKEIPFELIFLLSKKPVHFVHSRAPFLIA